jgi:hypothetical protein
MEKRKEFNCPLYMPFLDYEKAYDGVNRQKLWEILKSYGAPKSLLTAIKSLYEIITIKIN